MMDPEIKPFKPAYFFPSKHVIPESFVKFSHWLSESFFAESLFFFWGGGCTAGYIKSQNQMLEARKCSTKKIQQETITWTYPYGCFQK